MRKLIIIPALAFLAAGCSMIDGSSAERDAELAAALAAIEVLEAGVAQEAAEDAAAETARIREAAIQEAVAVALAERAVDEAIEKEAAEAKRKADLAAVVRKTSGSPSRPGSRMVTGSRMASKGGNTMTRSR